MSIFGDLLGQNKTATTIQDGQILKQAAGGEPRFQRVQDDKVGVQNGQVLTGSPINPIVQHDIEALSHLDARANQVLAGALEQAKTARVSFIEPEHILLALLSDREMFNLLQEFSVDVASLTRELQSKIPPGSFSGQPLLSDSSKQILEGAYSEAKKREVDFVTPEDILLSILAQSVTAADSLKQKGVEKVKVEEKLSKSAQFTTGKKSVLGTFGIDLTEEAKSGKLDPVTGRDREIERLVHILLRRTKNNPIVIGEAGVGKTAIVEGLAQLMVTGKISQDLASKKIIQLDLSALVAGASHRGEFEERLQNVIKEVLAASGQIILFIDEIHNIIGAGETEGSLDASNILKPYLGRGSLQIIGTTTIAEYRKKFEKDRAFERRFQPVQVDEPTEEVALEMLNMLQPKYESFHKVQFSPEAMQSAVHLSKRYIGERYLPDKAIDLIDEAGAQVRLEVASGKKSSSQVTEQDIEQVVSSWTGIPITKLTEKESEKLLKLEELIHQKFINHEKAVKAVSEAVRRGRIGLTNVNRPIASFIFLGPTGVGKTELAKRLAEIMFGKEDLMIRLDMSEYMEKHEVAKLVGAPPGYVGYEEGGQLTEAVRTKPYSIVLLDEVEKAHPDVFNILLQLLEDGRLTDNKGNTVSFKNTIIICTSNIGSDLIRDKLQESSVISHQSSDNTTVIASPTKVEASPSAGEAKQSSSVSTGHSDRDPSVAMLPQDDNFKQLYKLIIDQLNKFFKPELLNRFDEIVVFEPLSQANMLEIAKLGIEGTRKLLKDQNVDLQISQNALGQLAKEGYDIVYGARPLRRLIQRSIENPIAIYLINKSLVAGETIMVDYESAQDKFTFSKVQNSQQSTVNSPQTEQKMSVS